MDSNDPQYIKALEAASLQHARIERMGDIACAKINENANLAASRVIEAIDQAKGSIDVIEKAIGATLRKAETQGAKIDAQTKDFDDTKKKLAGIGEAVDDVEARITRARGFVHGVCDTIGQTVRLKSGGLKMTAAALASDGGILCVWSDAGGVYQQSIPLAALEIVKLAEREPDQWSKEVLDGLQPCSPTFEAEIIGCSDADALARLNDQAAAASMKFSPLLRRGAFGEKDAS